jgi:hypothetical protein
MPLLQDDSRFYLLMIVPRGVRLYQGTRSSLNAIDLPGAPISSDDGTAPSGPGHLASTQATSGSIQHAVYDAGLVNDKHARERIEIYFRRIDACVCALLQGEHAPLVIAGVDDLVPIYTGMSHYPHLEPTRIPGDPELTETTTLHDYAWRIVAPLVAKSQESAYSRFAQLSASAQASVDLPTILRAGMEGRIDHLFAANDRERWGTYDLINDKVREHQPRWPEDDDLLNLAIISALAHRSVVHVTSHSLMPDHADIAAIFRY